MNLYKEAQKSNSGSVIESLTGPRKNSLISTKVVMTQKSHASKLPNIPINSNTISF